MEVKVPEDACGVPGGDSSTCKDKCGVVNGDGASCADVCGVPNGDGKSCLDACGVRSTYYICLKGYLVLLIEMQLGTDSLCDNRFPFPFPVCFCFPFCFLFLFSFPFSPFSPFFLFFLYSLRWRTVRVNVSVAYWLKPLLLKAASRRPKATAASKYNNVCV